MQFDDRLATVLRMRADSDAARRTQFRQLLDLLGTAQADDEATAMDAGYARLEQLLADLSPDVQAAILRQPGLRLRNPGMVTFLAKRGPKPAAAAMASAQLTEAQWLDLIPHLPMTARGFLRHRRDLPESVNRLLQQLGVSDLVLPGAVVEPPTAASPDPAIGELRRRIEAFQLARAQQAQPRPAPVSAATGNQARLPLGDFVSQRETAPVSMLDLVTDAAGVVVQVLGRSAPMLIGLALTAPEPGVLVQFDSNVGQALRHHQPLRNAALTIDAAPEISGTWRIDAAALFHPAGGGFAGYAARLYRPGIDPAATLDTAANDAMRQVLHELRTPVNAIQGFAEIIQQQLFGAVPHEYRAHAAAIAMDAARLLAGFEEVDRLVRLENSALGLDQGLCDFRVAVEDTLRRLEGALRSREAGFALDVSGAAFYLAMTREEAMVLCWRLLASAAGALGPGERAEVALTGDGTQIVLALDIPETLRKSVEDERAEGQRSRAISAGMFGPRFTFRLADAEARAAGGSLTCDGDKVILRLPAATGDSMLDNQTGLDNQAGGTYSG